MLEPLKSNRTGSGFVDEKQVETEAWYHSLQETRKTSRLPETFTVAVENVYSLLADMLSAGFQIPVITLNYRHKTSEENNTAHSRSWVGEK